jgi:hypothetical protein
MKRAEVLRTLLVSAVAVLLGGTEGSAQESALLSSAKYKYGYTNWAGNTVTNYGHILTNWVPDFGSHGATNVFTTNENQVAGIVIHRMYGIEDAEAQAIFNLRITECMNVLSAHDALIKYLSQCADSQPFTNAVDVGQPIGDRGYVGPGNVSRVCFVRNNLFVRVHSEEGDKTGFDLAHSVDAQILDASRQ